jgi:tubulin-specific chaperone B
MADVPLHVISEYAASERRITPAWSIAQLKTKLEPITGIPPSCQKISLKTPSNSSIPVEAADEETVYMQSFPLVPYAELHVGLALSICSYLLRHFSFSHKVI